MVSPPNVLQKILMHFKPESEPTANHKLNKKIKDYFCME